MKYVLAVLALAGAVVSALALQVHYSTGTSPCSINEHWDCGFVNHSSYSMLGAYLPDGWQERAGAVARTPVAGIGLVGYLALGVVALLGQRRLFVALALGAFGVALFLTHIEKDVLEVWCLYCVISQSVIALMLAGGLGWLVAGLMRGRRQQAG